MTVTENRLDSSRWESHAHEALVHAHHHFHVTHNYNEKTGGFDHLSSDHEHEHDHAYTEHEHYPHQDFDYEHRFESHDHDHGEPVRKRDPAKKTTQTTKPAARKKSAARS